MHSGTPRALGEACLAEPQCAAIVLKPAGYFGMQQPVGVFRQAGGAVESLFVSEGRAGPRRRRCCLRAVLRSAALTRLLLRGSCSPHPGL